MKTRNNIITIITLILISSMVWLSCEKENNTVLLDEAQAMPAVEIPADIASSFTAEELTAYYEEIETANANNPLCYEFMPVMIKMVNEVTYIKESDQVRGIMLEGTGTWNEIGSIRYFERVSFPLSNIFIPPGTGCDGEGTIFFQKAVETENKVLSREELISFNSFDRVETDVIPRPEDGQTLHTTIYKARLSFTGGYGKYEGCFGNATKIETHDIRIPDRCTTTVLGYLFVKHEDVEDPKF